MEPDHDEPPDGEGQRQENGHVVDDDTEVGVEEDKGRPPEGEVLVLVATLQEASVEREGNVLHHDEHVGHGDS